MNQKSDKQNKLKLTVSALTIKSLESKAAPISTVYCDNDGCSFDEGPKPSTGWAAKVAAVAYY